MYGLDLVDRVIVLGRPDASSPTGAVIADGKPDEVFAEMGDVLAAGGAWVPGRAIPDYSPKQESAARCAGAQHRELKLWPWGRSWRWYQSGFLSRRSNGSDGSERRGQIDLGLDLGRGYSSLSPARCSSPTTSSPRHAGREPIDWKSKELLGRIGMVFQEPEHQFAAQLCA